MEKPPVPAPDEDERALVARLQAGDPDAFRSVYVAYHQRLWHYAYRYVRDEAVAEDVVHDVFQQIIERCASLHVEQGIAVYLYGAVRHRVLQLLRHDGVVRRSEDAYGDDVPALGGTLPEADAELLEHDLEARVQYHLRRLPERTQTLFLMRWKHQMSYPEIAQALGITPDAAKKLGQRVQVALRRLLEELRD